MLHVAFPSVSRDTSHPFLEADLSLCPQTFLILSDPLFSPYSTPYPPTKALSNHLLRPAQVIIYTTPLLPMLLKGRLDFKSGDRKVRRCSIVVWPQNESLNENQTFHSINIKSLLVNFSIWPYAKSPYHLFSRLIMCQLPRRYLCLATKL